MPGVDFALEPLLATVRARSTGLASPVHGDLHWRTVGANGLWIADTVAGVDRHVVFLFALLHDAMRENDFRDPEHGPRAAVLARQLHVEGAISISESQLEVLTYACHEHTNGLVSDDPTVGACWDADRLDLPRVGAVPRPELLSTDVARACSGSRPATSWPELAARL
jgi:uncharacterized protein